MNRKFILFLSFFAMISYSISSHAINFPEQGTTPGFIYNDSIAGTLVTYTNNYISSDNPVTMTNITSMVFAADNKVYINNIIGISDIHGYYDYVKSWQDAKLNADGSTIIMPNNILLGEGGDFHHTQVSSYKYYLCVVVKKPGNVVEEVDSIDTIEFSIESDGTIQPKFPTSDDSCKYALALKSHSIIWYNDSASGDLIDISETTTYTPYYNLEMSPVEILPPLNLEWNDMIMFYETFCYEDSFSKNHAYCKVAISDEKVYIMIYKNEYDIDDYNYYGHACLKGKMEGDKIVFKDWQIVGLPFDVKGPMIGGIIPNFNYARLINVNAEIEKNQNSDSYYLKTTPLGCDISFSYDPSTTYIGKSDTSFILDPTHSYTNAAHCIRPIFNAKYSGIDGINVDIDKEDENAPYINLFGEKFSTRPVIPGIYIRNGKKLLIR